VYDQSFGRWSAAPSDSSPKPNEPSGMTAALNKWEKEMFISTKKLKNSSQRIIDDNKP
jgi:hypothetical protein